MQKHPWRVWLPNVLVLIGGSFLLWAILVSLNPLLFEGKIVEGEYLTSQQEVNLPLPQISSIRDPQTSTEDVFYALVHNPYTPTPTPTATPTPTPTAVPSGPVVKLVIPSINVTRAVIPLRQYRDSSGQLQYDTDSLFATRNRLDLVGQTVTSSNPGAGSNTVLVGHNYNRGWHAWEGVFVNLKKLKPGDKIVLHTEDGSKHSYRVKKIVEVPYVYKNTRELNKHLRYLGPSINEKVTLVTCGGSFGVWSTRVYVIAR